MYINHITACSTAFYRFLSFPSPEKQLLQQSEE